MIKIITLIISLLMLTISCKKENNKKVASTEINIKTKYSCTPQITDSIWFESNNKAPLFKGLDALNYPISTKRPEAQNYFNQGLLLAYGFNHAEAARSFYYATKLDPDCAMAYWGYAYVLGPNYNGGMDGGNYEKAFKAIQTAKRLSINATQKEQALIDAMVERYTKTPLKDRTALDIAYSSAMKTLSKTYPNDADINTLYTESIMNLHPWDLFDKSGEPKEWTPEIISNLENILKENPDHPGAHHFYIHAVEMSNSPERANSSARAFDDGLVSGAGHLLHMPSHIYIRTGEYHKGTLANIAAVKADSTYVTKCHAQGVYPLAYYPHNYHFMAATATLEGNSQWAMIGANKVSSHIHPDIMKAEGWGTLQHYYVIPYYVAVKLGKWDNILSRKLETFNLNYPEAIKHYAEGMAYLNTNNMNAAKEKLIELEVISKDESLKRVTIWEINTTFDLVHIARLVLKAEILAKEELFNESISLLNEAIAIEDALNYNEPPDWFFSVRHILGAVQIDAGKYNDAIETYVEDLKRLPKNGWAQQGLKRAYKKLNDLENLSRVEALINESWSTSDIQLLGSKVK